MKTTATAITIDRGLSPRVIATAALVLTGLTLLAARPGRAELVVRADLGPVRVVVADARPACLPLAVPARPLGRAGLILPVVPRVCRLDLRHAHRYVFVPGHWERGRGHRAVWVAGRYVCRGERREPGGRVEVMFDLGGECRADRHERHD